MARAETERERPTRMMPRDELLGLVDQTAEPELQSLAHTVSREQLRARGSARDLKAVLPEQSADEEPQVSLLAVLFVLCLFVTLFVALIRLG